MLNFLEVFFFIWISEKQDFANILKDTETVSTLVN